jgi:hypothetical protein
VNRAVTVPDSSTTGSAVAVPTVEPVTASAATITATRVNNLRWNMAFLPPSVRRTLTQTE